MSASLAAPAARPEPARHRERLWPLLFPLLALILLAPAVFGGEAIGPVGSLAGFSPWREATGAPPESLPQWNVLHWDGIAQFYPWRGEVARAYAAGRLPLWNDATHCGTPLLANSQSAPLYPPHALLALPWGHLAAPLALLAAFHLALAGWFTFLLARWYGLRPAAAAVAGATFELSGFTVAWLPLPSLVSVACWIPAGVWLVSRAVRAGSLRDGCLAGGVVGLMLLAGHLQVAAYGLLALGAAALAELGGARGAGSPALARRLLAGGLAAVVGGALAAAQVLPALELSRVSHRLASATEAGYAGYVALALPPQNWITLIVPDFYGLPAAGNFWGFWRYGAPNTVEYAGHGGAAALPFVFVGLLLGYRVSPRAWLWAALGGVALLLAAGTPLNRMLYFGLPGFAQSGSPARCLVLFCLAQALLAGFGVEALLRAAAGDWRRALPPLGAGAAATAALAGGAWAVARAALPGGPATAQLLEEIGFPALVRALLLAGLGAGLAALLAWLLRDNSPGQRAATVGAAALGVTAGGALWLASALVPTGPRAALYPDLPLTTALREAGARVATVNRAWSLADYAPAVLPPNASLAYGWRDAQGYDSLALAAYRRLANGLAGGVGETDAAPAANGNMLFIKDARSPLLAVMGVRYVVARDPVPGLRPAAGFPAGPPHVYDLGPAVEAYAATRWVEATDADAVTLLAAAPPPAWAVVPPGGGAPPRPDLLPTPGAPARVERPAPGRVRVTAEPATPALLVLAEACAPGWEVRVQERGRPARWARPVRANVGFQGVPVASGPVTAEWIYRPASFRVGLFLSLLALAAWLAGAAAGPRRNEGPPAGKAAVDSEAARDPA